MNEFVFFLQKILLFLAGCVCDEGHCASLVRSVCLNFDAFIKDSLSHFVLHPESWVSCLCVWMFISSHICLSTTKLWVLSCCGWSLRPRGLKYRSVSFYTGAQISALFDSSKCKQNTCREDRLSVHIHTCKPVCVCVLQCLHTPLCVCTYVCVCVCQVPAIHRYWLKHLSLSALQRRAQVKRSDTDIRNHRPMTFIF